MCWLTAAGLVGAAVAACDSNDNVAGGAAQDSGAPDAAPPNQTDAAPQIDSGTPDAGPIVSESLGTTGLVNVFPDAIQAEFRVDDTILRVSNAPECVAHISALGKTFANAGQLTVGGTIVGADGGPSEPIVFGPDPDNGYFLPGPVFPSDPLLTVQVALAGFASVPAMGVQTLHVLGNSPLEVTAPVPITPDGGLPDDDGGPPPPPPPPDDDGGLPPPPPPDNDGGLPPPPGPGPGAPRQLEISSVQPLEIHWVVPGGSTATQRVLVTFRDIAGMVASKTARLFCDYPVTQGTAVIPANLLAELRTRVGEGARGQFTVLFGDRKVYSVSTGAANVSYVVDVTRHDSSTLHPDGNFIDAQLK